MALQIKIDSVEVLPRGDKNGKSISMRLRCWTKGVDVDVVLPVITSVASESIKGYVGDQTDAQLEQRAKDAIQAKFQVTIDRYKACEATASRVDTAAMADSLKR